MVLLVLKNIKLKNIQKMQKFDAERFLGDYNIPTTDTGPNSHKGWLQVCCPFCRPADDNWHGGFYVDGDGHYNCWKCKRHRTAEVVQALLSVPYSNAVQIAREYSAGFPPKVKRYPSKEDSTDGPSEISLPPGCVRLFGPYKKYLLGRNFDPVHLQEKYGLVAGGRSGEQKFRIVAPIHYNGRLVSYQGRDITGMSPMRYRACAREGEAVHHKHIFYNLDNARGNKAILVEGIFDVMRMGDGCIGSFGTEVTMEQIRLLTKRFDVLHVLFDPERDATKKGSYITTIKCLYGKKANFFRLDSGDPSDLSPDDAVYLKRYLLG